MYHHFRDEVVISCPIEGDAIPLMSLMKLQFSGTSNTHWMSDYYPTRLRAGAQPGEWEEAMELYWKVKPARGANGAVRPAYIGGTSVLNRTHVEVPGLAGRLQRRPAARAGACASRTAS